VPSSEHQLLADLFKDRPESGRVTALVGQIASILNLLPPGYAGAGLWESKTTLHPVELSSERVALLYNRQGAAARALVVEIQQDIKEDKRRSWPVYAWAAWRETGVDADVVVIAPDDAVARWEQGTITNGRHTFNVQVIGRHNLPVITDEQEAKAKPLLALLSAGVHLQSSTPPAGSSQIQADKDRQSAAQMKIADTVARDIGLPDAEIYVRVLFNHLNAEARTMALEDSGPFLTKFEQEARAQVKAAHEHMVEMALEVYEARFAALSGDLRQDLRQELVKRTPEELVALGGELAKADTPENAQVLIRGGTVQHRSGRGR